MAKKKKKKVVKKSKPLSRSQQLANIKKQAQSIQNSLNKSVASGQIKSSGGGSSSTPKPTGSSLMQQAQQIQQNLNQSVASGQVKSSAPSSDLKNLSIGLAGGTGSAVSTSGGQETPEQTVARVSQQGGNAVIPTQGTSDDLKNLSIGMTQQPADWAQQFMSQLQGQNPDTSGVGTQSTQGDASAGMQEGMNDAVAGVAGQTMGATGSIGGTPGTTMPSGPAGASGAMPMTGATGGYVKIGPAYFEKYSDGLRAVSDSSVISGLKHGTIPYSTQGLDGTTFSRYSVPLMDAGKQAVADANLRAMGLPAEGDMVNEGAGIMNTYQNYQQKYNLQQSQTDYFNDPMKTIKDITTKIFEMSGVSDANDMISDITGDLEDLENERDDKIADINDNPWLTEGVRLRQIASVEARYEDKINNHTNRLRLLEDVRNNAQQQAQFAVGTAISLWDKERTFQQHQIDMWNENAQREIDNGFKAQQLALAEKTSGTDIMQEYLFAKENGYTGDIIDYRATVAARTRAPSSVGPGSISEQLYAGLSSPTATAVRGLVSKYSSDPTVQNFATIQDGYLFSQSIDSNTQNPADDQALIYSLAKALDPGSVVREGEYATAQKYAQSWVAAYGKGVTQALAGTGFLSTQARENIKSVIEQKYNTSAQTYGNMQNQYVQAINSLTGRSNGSAFLVDYMVPTMGGGGQTPSSFGVTQESGLMSMVPSGPAMTLPGGQTVTRVQ